MYKSRFTALSDSYIYGEALITLSPRSLMRTRSVLDFEVTTLMHISSYEAALQLQQADAVIAAREQIVEGAVTMVDQALKRLEADDIVTMDEERRAQMVSNLLVVLCSDQRTQPVVNAGSLYA